MWGAGSLVVAMVLLLTGCCCGRCCCGCCCCCWQSLRLPPRGVVRFLCWHVRKLEFWHFAHPQLNFASAFASVFAVFYSKKDQKKCPSSRAALCKNVLTSAFRIFFFRCFPVCVHSASVNTVLSPTLDFLHMPAWTCISLSALFGGWRGDDVHANAPFVFSFFCSCMFMCWCGTSVGSGGWGGG